ncbi:hypothetical protein L615_003900000280 [Nocardioides sp. J9]|uniref:hypothetical protein n=1 Tax=Nocardioides sp. J9 TaxID=935844 RepID=UPI0011AAE8E3|nr:hypothetical protein [Nocardioides sp. J9]TWG97105.1 hypothetical protein L615_003900000280 [Nocardioides sp. J9]
MRHISLAVALTAAAATAATVPLPAGAAPDTEVFVVSTQFWDGPSPVVAATGPFAGCTSVQELDGAQAIQTGPNSVLFVGTKELDCADGTVTIAYEATINTRSGRKTFGTWSVVDSTLDGVAFGGGRLTGDAARCELLPGAEGCILDTFTGSVGG